MSFMARVGGRSVDAQLVVCCSPVTAQTHPHLATGFSPKGNTKQEESSKASGTDLAPSKKFLGSENPQNKLICQGKSL